MYSVHREAGQDVQGHRLGMCCDVLWLPGVTKGADTLAGVLQGSESCHLKFKLDTVQSATLAL